MTYNEILKVKTHLINFWILMENNTMNNSSTSMSQQMSCLIESTIENN